MAISWGMDCWMTPRRWSGWQGKFSQWR
jgi:hypothetical protein